MNTDKSAKISARPYFENLTGLRFLGALTVFFFHIFTLNREIWGSFYDAQWFDAIYKVASKGHLGINLFFVLSGFLITYLLLWEQKQNGKINLFHYLMRRTLRVWPLYFLIVVFGFFLFPRIPYGIETVHELWRYALFLANFDELIIGLKDNINFLTAIWTVSVEEQFYIVWGVLIGLFSFRSKYASILFFALILVGSIIFRSFHLTDERVLYFHSFSVMSDLAIGGFIGYLAFHKKIQSYFRELPKWGIVLVYLIGTALIILEGKLFTGTSIAISRFVPGLFFGFVILEQVYANNSFFKVDRIPLMKFSGEISYGFYMFHCIFIYYWSIFFNAYDLTDSIAWFVLYATVVFLSTYATAILSYHYFEQPFLKLKKRFK